jgi:Type IV secretory pathway, VirD4 components
MPPSLHNIAVILWGIRFLFLTRSAHWKKDFKERGFEKPARFNPLASLDPEDNTFMADVSALCEALIIDEGKDPHWANSARDLISARIMWVCKYGKEEEKTLPAVRDFLTLNEEKFCDAIAIMAECDFPPVRNKAAKFINSSKELDSVKSTAQTQTAFLDDPCLRESLSGDDFRFIDLKRQK